MNTTPKEFKPILDELRKIREHLEQLRQAIKAAEESREKNRDVKPFWIDQILSEYQESVTDKKIESERNRSVQKSLKRAAWLTFVAAVVYAALTYGLLRTARRTVSDNQESTEKQLAKLREYVDQAKRGNDIAIAANRPWIGVIIAPPEFGSTYNWNTINDPVRGKLFDLDYVWFIKNAGKRPGRLEKVMTTASIDHNVCTEHPAFRTATHPPHIKGGEPSSKGFLLPDTLIMSKFRHPILLKDWNLLMEKQETIHFCIYISIEYRDADFPEMLHHSTDCRMMMPGVDYGFVGCNNNYPNAD